MAFVIDSCVAVKWAIEEAGSDRAQALIGEELIAPDLLQAEAAHVLSKRSRAGEFDALHALASLALIEEAITFQSSGPLSRRALELSLELRHPAADCFFLALAEAADLPVITADAKFVAACQGTPYEHLVQLL